MKKNIAFGYIRIFLCAISWGFLPIFTRLLYASGSDPLSVSAMRAYLSGAMALVVLLLCRGFKNVKVKDFPFYILYGFCAISATSFFYASSLELLSTAMAAILLYTGPAFVNILNRIFYKIPITPVKRWALFLTFGGCAIVVRIYDFAAFKANGTGIVLGILSGICYSCTTVLGRKAREKNPGYINGLLILIFGTLAYGFTAPPWKISVAGLYQFGLYAGIAFFGSMFPYTCYLSALDCGMDGGIASIAATVEPVMACILGFVLLGDKMDLAQVMGILIVLFGVTLPILHEIKVDMAVTSGNDKRLREERS